MLAEKRDYYRVLEVDPVATSQAIRVAYAEMLQKLQPDAPQQRRELDEAYEVLSNPAKRALYDYLRATMNRPQKSKEELERWRSRQEQARQVTQHRLQTWRQRATSDQPA